jgi:hypothetical protein
MIVLMIVRAVAMSMMVVMRVVIVVVRAIVMMIVGMAAMVVMIIPIIVVVGVLMIVVVMVMPVAMRRAGISAAFRIERTFDGDDLRAEAARHILDHVIAPDPQGASRQLDRQVTIAEMPGDPRERHRVLAADLGERLRGRHHFDNAAVFERQAVACAQHQSVGQIEQKGEALDAGHRHPAAMTVIVIEHDGIGGRAGPGAGRANGAGGEHGGAILDRTGHPTVSATPKADRFPLAGLRREEKPSPGGRKSSESSAEQA